MRKNLNRMEKERIEQRAQKILDVYGYGIGTDVYVDAVRLARYFGFTVNESESLSANEDGSITVSADGSEKCIVVNKYRSFESKRFIIMHELSHYLLHYTGEAKLFRHRENIKGKNMEENDADYLAACLLMPEVQFRKYYTLYKRDYSYSKIVFLLQEKFKTPRESIERRIGEVCA